MRLRPRRLGFTLMEVLLASAIGLIVLSGVYLAIDTQLKFAEEGRSLIEEATLARSLTARITSDLAPCVGQPDPSRYRSKNAAQPATTTEQSGTAVADTSGMETPQVVRAFIGGGSNLTVFVSRVPRATSSGASKTTTDAGMGNLSQIESDQKLITYWLAGGGGQPLGLARYEEPLSTATADGLPAVVGGGDESKYVIAPEVVAFDLRYYDGTNWESEWDGRKTGTDENVNTPIGPPKAIAIEFKLKTKGIRGEKDRERSFRHVIAIPTANGSTQTNTDQAPPEEP